MAHVYDWARARGYWLRAGEDRAASHLLLDGGRLAVPPESHGALLNAYAASLLAHPGRPPCMVEVRTPVFRMFMDVDTRFGSHEAAARAGALEGPVAGALRAVAAAACPGHAAIVCAASRPKREEREGGDAAHKMGFHLVWPEALVTSRTALALRQRALDALRESAELADPGALGLLGRWEDILDAVVYRSSGLRMAWSAKGRHDDRLYVPRARISEDGSLAPLPRPSGVAALRELVRELSVRCFESPTITHGVDGVDGEDGTHGPDSVGTAYAHKSLAAYADVLPLLAAALPLEFVGQRFAGLLAGETCFLLRSTARHCFNLGRQHRTNNVYFVLTRRGVCQRCYCRCETDEGRRYGMCKDFSSEVWPVPPEVVEAFFKDAGGGGSQDDSSSRHSTSSTAPAPLGAMPSRAAKASLGFDALVRRSRPAALAASKPAPKRKKSGR